VGGAGDEATRLAPSIFYDAVCVVLAFLSVIAVVQVFVAAVSFAVRLFIAVLVQVFASETQFVLEVDISNICDIVILIFRSTIMYALPFKVSCHLLQGGLFLSSSPGWKLPGVVCAFLSATG